MWRCDYLTLRFLPGWDPGTGEEWPDLGVHDGKVEGPGRKVLGFFGRSPGGARALHLTGEWWRQEEPQGARYLGLLCEASKRAERVACSRVDFVWSLDGSKSPPPAEWGRRLVQAWRDWRSEEPGKAWYSSDTGETAYVGHRREDGSLWYGGPTLVRAYTQRPVHGDAVRVEVQCRALDGVTCEGQVAAGAARTMALGRLLGLEGWPEAVGVPEGESRRAATLEELAARAVGMLFGPARRSGGVPEVAARQARTLLHTLGITPATARAIVLRAERRSEKRSLRAEAGEDG